MRDKAADLIAVSVCALFAVAATWFQWSLFLRAPPGILLVLFTPGYALTAYFYPGGGIPTRIRLALAFGFSLALVPLVALALNFSPIGIHPIAVTATLACVTWVFCLLAWSKRPAVGAARSPVGGPLPSRAALPVAVLAITALVLAGLAMVIARSQSISAPYTEFYILGSGGRIGDYPTKLAVGGPQDYHLGVVNHESSSTSYRIVPLLDGVEVGGTGGVSLPVGESWDATVTVVPRVASVHGRLTFNLYREGDATPYHEVFVLVDVTGATS